jgi:hypothetical protein
MGTRSRSVAGALTVALAITAVGVPLGVRVAGAAEPPREWDGLELRDSKNVDRLYLRPVVLIAGTEGCTAEIAPTRFAVAGDDFANALG